MARRYHTHLKNDTDMNGTTRFPPIANLRGKTLERQIEELKERLKRKEDELELYEFEKKRIHEKTESERKALERLCNAARDKCAKKEILLKRLEERYTRLIDKSEGIHNQLQIEKKVNVQLQRKTVALDELEEKYTHAVAEIAALNAANDTFTRNFNSESNQEIADLKKQVEDEKSAHNKTKAIKERIEKQYFAAWNKLDEHQKKLNLTETISHVLSSTERNIHDLRIGKAKAEVNGEHLKRELQDLKENQEQTVQELNTLKDQNEILTAQNEELRARATAYQNKLNRHAKEKSNLDRQERSSLTFQEMKNAQMPNALSMFTSFRDIETKIDLLTREISIKTQEKIWLEQSLEHEKRLRYRREATIEYTQRQSYNNWLILKRKENTMHHMEETYRQELGEKEKKIHENTLQLNERVETIHELKTECDQVKEEKERIEMCCICLVGKKEYAVEPCGHVFCSGCTQRVFSGKRICYNCRTNITHKIKIYVDS